ncbi:hypothetical protein MIND_00822900 [Mycena indigotica]|uniref:Uncharacterized protein n=1 Tax=Mycena indigotica TaxID=2126181 RepID=A0A8H6VYF2_9AGAR|nr:uncharacterized protein MIND_00822900 [Mycena indigotica]KAF7298754.1 hypothetical protein MIND_00822900 [Mycena indigotica]
MASASRWRSDGPTTPTPSARGRGGVRNASRGGRGRGRDASTSNNSKSSNFLSVPQHAPAPQTPRSTPSPDLLAVPPRTPSRMPMTPNSSPGRRMDLVASVSRSGGIERDGDDLKDWDMQEAYREYIQGKLDAFWKKYPHKEDEGANETRQRIESQENLLILFRKLREGIIASKRSDKFSDDVYSTSLYLSVLFDSARHISAVVPIVISYLSTTPASVSSPEALTLICLLQHLVTSYPSQTAFHTALQAVPLTCFPFDCPERRWVNQLARYLRAGNYTKADQLSGVSFLKLPMAMSDPLAKKAVVHLVEALRVKARETAWRTIRTVYREISISASSQTDSSSDTKAWLLHSLLLRSPKVDEDVSGLEESLQQLNLSSDALDRWLESEQSKGNVAKKEGVEGRWILVRPR